MLLIHLNKFFCYLGKAVKNDFRLMLVDYQKVISVIKSCKCKEHLDVANRLIISFHIKHGNSFLIKKLKKTLYFKKRIIIKKY